MAKPINVCTMMEQFVKDELIHTTFSVPLSCSAAGMRMSLHGNLSIIAVTEQTSEIMGLFKLFAIYTALHFERNTYLFLDMTKKSMNHFS